MFRINLLLSFLLLTFGLTAQNTVNIIPKPVSLTVNEGSFTIDYKTSVKYIADKDLQAAAKYFTSCIKDISDVNLAVVKNPSKTIELKYDKAKVPQAEGYILTVTKNKITITANNRQGILFGIQSILQTLPAIRTNGALNVPCMEITDYPAFKWRGMHLDVSRHFFSPETVKTYIDLIAKYKFNTFHWHLIDDQGWRLEIKKYPKLTSVGAWRVDRNHLDWDDREIMKPGEKPTYGGFYTQAQVREIVAYAAERGVTVVPEIEMPAHVESAIAAYPNLSCIQKPQSVLPGGIYPVDYQTSYCAGNEDVFKFLEDVLTETMSLFPSKYIHIGGDELDKRFWEKCPKCQKRMKDEGLKDVDELQSYFIKRMEKFVVSKGRKIIGWDEILEGGLAPEATVMSWRGEAGGIAAAKMNHDVIMTPGNPLYFDHYQAGPQGEPLANGGFNTLGKVYNYYPVPKELTPEQAKHILGAQANLWAEFIKTRLQVEYMVLPRMAALAEVVWTPVEMKNFADFRKRLQSHFVAYGQSGLNFSKGNYSVEIKPLIENGKLNVQLNTEMPDVEIRYTTDGSLPNPNSLLYSAPFEVTSSINVKAVTVENGKVMPLEPSSQSFVMHKAIGGSVNYVNKNSNAYPADGPNSLVDGIRGTYAVGKFWHGFSGKDLIATIDLGSVKNISSISLGCLQHYRDWIFMPTEVSFEVSVDGINFKQVGKEINNIPPTETQAIIKDFTARFNNTDARYIRVTAKVLPEAPKGHPGEGKPVWIFADEVMVE